MSLRYARHFARVYNTPLLIHPGRLDAMLPALERVLRGEAAEPVSQPPVVSEEEALAVVTGGIAVIPVHGVLTHRGSYDAQCNYLMGYDDLLVSLGAALEDPRVSQVVLDIDSPGGEVAGCFDLADRIAEVAQIKPVHACINDLGCSAAYALASACTSISCTRTATVGSIGVVLRHVDQSEWLRNEGIKVTHIFAGAHKVDGNPFEPLPDAVRERFQSEIDALYGLFVATVARNRGLTEQAVIHTEADTFLGPAAVERGLADRIETIHEMLFRLGTDALAINPKETSMATDDQATAPVAADDAHELAELNAYQKGREDERTRVFQILNHPHAEGREKLAHHLALQTEMSAEAAAGILEHSEPVSPAAAQTPLTRMMAGLYEPPLGPGDEAGSRRVLPREQFDAMPAADRRAFLKSGGRLTASIQE